MSKGGEEMLLNKGAVLIALANNSMNLRDLSEVAGVTVSAISKGLNNGVHMRTANIGKLARALGVPVESIILREEG